MTLINCSECGREISSLAPTCPNCGAPVALIPPARPGKLAAKDMGGGTAVIAFFLALIMGALSGFLIYMAAALIFQNWRGGPPSGLFVAVTMGGGTVLTVYLILKDVKSLSRIMSRGLLLGAAEWFLMIPVSIVFAGKTVVETAGPTVDPASTIGTTLGGGIVAAIGIGLSLLMAIACLTGGIIFYLLGRELKPED